MRSNFTDLTKEQQETFGNGCGLYARFLNVPDFVFTASCRHHDFNFVRGVGANNWYENVYKWPFYYVKANWDFFTHMIHDSTKWWHYVVSVAYFLGVILFSWPFFDGGPWKSTENILEIDRLEKET